MYIYSKYLTYTSIHTYKYILTTHTYIYIHTSVHTYNYIPTYIYTSIHIHPYTYTYAYSYAYTYIYIYIHINEKRQITLHTAVIATTVTHLYPTLPYIHYRINPI